MAAVNFLMHYFSVCSVENVNNMTSYCNNACTNLFDYPFRFYSKNCYISLNPISRTPQLIQQNGYDFESYNLTTPDGYNVTLFRIPPKENDMRKKKQPVFLQTGIMMDSSQWVNTNNRSLAFNLANQGYDVWLGNHRSSRYGRLHAKHKYSDPEFWNYDLEDQAVNETLTCLKEVARITQQSIIYIGHSKGTTMFFIFASEYPEEAQKLLKASIALAPIAYVDFAQPKNMVYKLYAFLAGHAKVPSVYHDMETMAQFSQIFCGFFPYVCRQFIDSSFGKTSQFLPSDLITFYSAVTTASARELFHFKQLADSGKFQKFDLGKEGNRKKYGQDTPPLYNLKNIKLPVYLLYGKNDLFTSTKIGADFIPNLLRSERDSSQQSAFFYSSLYLSLSTNLSVSKILKELGSAKKMMYSVPIHENRKKYQFNHMDFIYSKYMRRFLLDDLFKILENELL